MALTPGASLGRFELLALLGRGGMGEVWRARDPVLAREVAIKVLPEEVAADRERVARFEREARALAALNHPSVAQIFEVGEAAPVSGEGGGSLTPQRFLVMELVAGQSLSQRLGAGCLEVRESLSVALQVAKALQAAHTGGVIHRDLKPGNILLPPGGDAKVVDFGLARFHRRKRPGVESDITLTLSATGSVVGTASYMAPEQLRGEDCDESCDVWAFGCCLGEMLSGRPLFDAPSIPEIVGKILGGEADLSGLPRDMPDHMRSLLSRCLDLSPRRRPGVSEVIGALEAFLGGTKGLRLRRPRSWWMVAAGIIVGAIVAVALWPSRQAIRRSDRPHGPLRVTLAPVSERALGPDLERLRQLIAGEVVRQATATQGVELVESGGRDIDVSLEVLPEGAGARLRALVVARDSGAIVALIEEVSAPGTAEATAKAAAAALAEALQRETICRELESDDALHGFLVRRTTVLAAARAFREGVQLYVRTRLGPAEASFSKARQADPAFWPAFVYLAQVAGASSRFREGRELLREGRALLAEPAAAERVVLEVAEALLAAEPQRMLEALERARTWFPDSGELRYRTAWAYRSLDRPRDAIPLLEGLLDEGWQPDWSPTREQLGYNQMAAGRFEDAIETAAAGEERFPQRYSYALVTALALQQLERGKEAREALTRAVRKRLDFTRTDPLVIHQTAQWWASLLRWHAEAERHLEQCLRLTDERLAEDPTDVAALLARGEALIGLGRFGEAARLLEGFQGDLDGEPYRLIALARARFGTGDGPGARVALVSAGEQWRAGEGAALGRLAYNIGCAWAVIGTPEEALEWFLRARDQYGIERLDVALDPDLDPLRRAGLLGRLTRNRRRQ